MSKRKLLNYRVSGTGRPVVFLHGFLESNTMWDQLLPGLSNVKAICIELPGHGASINFINALSLEKLAAEVQAVIIKENITNYSIIGHSLGGYVALALLKSQSEINCTQLILLNSHPWEDSAIKKAERSQVAKIVLQNKSLFIKQAIPNLFQKPEEHSIIVKNLISEALEISAQAISDTTIAMRERTSTESTIIKYNHITTVIQGEFDRLIPAQKMEVFCRKNKINFIKIKDSGHMTHIEQKVKLIEVLSKLLNDN